MTETLPINREFLCRFGFPATYHADRLSWWQGNAALWGEYVEGNRLRMELLRSIATQAANLVSADSIGRPRITDIGCGEGQFLRMCRAHMPSADLYGVDFCSEMLNQGRGRSLAASIAFGLADIETPEANLPTDQDLVVSVLCLDEIERIDEAFENLARSTRPKGWLIAVTLDPVRELLRHLGDFSRQASGNPSMSSDNETILIEKHFSIGATASPFPYCRVIRPSTAYNEAGLAHGFTLGSHIRWRGETARNGDPSFEVRVFQKQ